jgi:hypothetical protein
MSCAPLPPQRSVPGPVAREGSALVVTELHTDE